MQIASASLPDAPYQGGGAVDVLTVREVSAAVEAEACLCNSRNVDRYRALVKAGKRPNVAKVAVASELVRQIAKYNPERIIIVDIYENNAYEIQQELVMDYGEDLDLVTLIASVRDYYRMNQIFEKYKPQIVFHAAAHKHVPLMEDSPMEAIKNNVVGTFNVATLAQFHDAEKFVMISTDKAVNPTNAMGASKRCCENPGTESECSANSEAILQTPGIPAMGSPIQRGSGACCLSPGRLPRDETVH